MDIPQNFIVTINSPDDYDDLRMAFGDCFHSSWNHTFKTSLLPLYLVRQGTIFRYAPNTTKDFISGIDYLMSNDPYKKYPWFQSVAELLSLIDPVKCENADEIL